MLNYKYFIKFLLFFMIVLFATTACEDKSIVETKGVVSLIIPLYIYPTTVNPQTKNTYWDDVANRSSINTKITAIINPSNGDHGKYLDENFKKGIKKLKVSGISVVAYTYTKYAHREQDLIKKSIDFYKKEYQVDAFFLDEVNSSKEAMPYYKEIQNYINKSSKSNEIILNPGVVPDDIMMNDTSMQRVIFEGEYKTFINEKNRAEVSEQSREYNVCLIYNVAKEDMEDTINLAIVKRCGQLYITDDSEENPWDTLPSYWIAMLKCINKLNLI